MDGKKKFGRNKKPSGWGNQRSKCGYFSLAVYKIKRNLAPKSSKPTLGSLSATRGIIQCDQIKPIGGETMGRVGSKYRRGQLGKTSTGLVLNRNAQTGPMDSSTADTQSNRLEAEAEE